MPSSVLASSWHKFHWAERHMEALNAEFHSAFGPEAEPITIDSNLEVDGDEATLTAHVQTLAHISTDAALIVGDTLANFRAALDHLAWDLVSIGSQPHPKDPRQIYFPVAKNATSFKAMLGQRLPGVPKPHVAIVRRYQPYRSGETAKAMRWLRNLSDVDKHRVMTPMLMNVSNVSATITSNWTVTSLTYGVTRPQPLNVGTELLRATLARSGAGECAVNVESHMPIYPALSYRRPIGEVLIMIRDAVRSLLGEFDAIL